MPEYDASPRGRPAVADTPPPTWREPFTYTVDMTGSKALGAGTVNALPSSLSFTAFEVTIHSDSDFEILHTIYVHTDPRVYVRYTDGSAGRALQRGTQDLRLVAGIPFTGAAAVAQPAAVGIPNETSAFWTYFWPSPHVLAASTIFEVLAADFSGATNTVRLSFHGNKIRPGYPPWARRPDGSPIRYKSKTPFILGLPSDATLVSTGIAANGVLPVSTTLDQEADFLVYSVTAQWQGAFTVLLSDGGRDRNWMDRAVHVACYAGNGQWPRRFAVPRFIPRGSTITGIFSDLSGAANRARLFLHGVKLIE